MASEIADYALIGDGRTCALVSRTGSIDFLCLPRFDSDPCLLALLGDETCGRWALAPGGYVRAVTRRYRPDTLVLETDFEAEGGRIRVTDFMPWDGGAPRIVRRVEGLSGEVDVEMRLRLRFDYGRMPPWLQVGARACVAEAGPDRASLFSTVPLRREGESLAAEVRLAAGRTVDFVLAYSDACGPAPARPRPAALLSRTESAWRDWIGRFERPCRWSDAVKRSLMVLRALIDRRSGGLVAAATLGLPEVPQGRANWDYRYCWLRDATFTLTALLNAGYQDEARRWRDWILRAVAGRPQDLQIVYRIDGGRRLPERTADWLPGHFGARPVRIGNAAADQVQLDAFGELMDSFHVAAMAGIDRGPRGRAVETALVEHLESVWDQPGSDIWESRGPPQRYTYSQAMAWVALDRFLKSKPLEDGCDAALVGRLGAVRDEIHRSVCARGYDSDRGSFVQHYGSRELDASLLLLPLIGFLPVEDPRIAGTISAVERELMEGGFVRRKPAAAGEAEEGAFLACSCWLADCMALQGRRAEAASVLERVLGVANDVGLLSEEYHVPTRRLVGNTPQALTHLAVVNTALSLSGPVIQRAGG